MKITAVTHIFTFCSESIYRDCYVEIPGEYIESRAIMSKYYGIHWGFQYSSKESAGVLKYNLREIGLDGKDNSGNGVSFVKGF